MEGIHWIRIGAIAALVLGSLYVLSPTLLADSEGDLASAAGSVTTSGPKKGPSLEVRLPLVSGDGTATADAVRARLDAAKVPVSRVTADGIDVVVELAAGGSRDDAIRLASTRGSSALFAVDQVLPTGAAPGTAPVPTELDAALRAIPGLDLAVWTGRISALPGLAIPPEAEPLTGTWRPTLGESGLRFPMDAQPLPEGLPLAAVAVDDRVAGVVTRDGVFHTLVPSPDVFAVLAAGPLPGVLGPARPLDAAPEAVTDDGATPADGSSLPPWLLGLLPDTAIALGLDLQGGIDLTLQVELDEAVLGQATRDIAYLKDVAAKEGLVLDSVRRSHTSPVVEVTTASPLADLQTFLSAKLPDYTYVETDGAVHRFEMTESRQEQVRDQSVEQVLETLRKRVDATGVKEPSIVKKGGGRINVQLPGMEDVQSAVDAIGTTAVLEFRMVDEEFDDAYLEQILAAAEQGLPPDQFQDDDLLNVWLWDNQRLDEDRLILWEYETTPEGEVRAMPYPLRNEIVLTGNDVNDAGVGWDQNQQPYVSLEFKPRGGQIFCDVTGESVGKRFAIVLDDHVMSAPSIRERICGGAARIEMSSANDPMKESQTLALVLRTGALDAPVVVASVRQVGASLGADAIRQGSIAAVLGSLLVLTFMAAWYRVAGLVADVALVINVMLVLACLALFGATLTLPGIAGIALTVGMAVDANIIVYERIREELRLGVQARKAVDAGFDKALVAILDANITTAIAGVVLFSYGTGPIKGFAVTLLIGIATTLVSALFVSRTILELLTRSSTARLRI